MIIEVELITIINTVIMILNAFCVIKSLNEGNYKTAVFNGFATGLLASSLLTTLFEYI